MKYQPYPAYKDSGLPAPRLRQAGVEWLGQIPAHWEVKRLKYTSSINDETLSEDTDPTFEIAYVDIGGVDSVKGITEKETLLFQNAPSRARRIVRDGDVIVSTVRTYLRAIAAIQNPQAGLIVSTGFAVVRPKKPLLSRFAAYGLHAPYFVERVVAESVGVSYPAINEGLMGCFPLALPPSEEQRAITAFLDRETAKIDTLAAKKERLIELLQEKRAALITHAITKGLDPTVPLKDPEVEWQGRIPAHWDVAPTWTRYAIQLGKMLDTGRISGEHLAPYLRNIDVQWDRVNVEGLPEMDFSPADRKRFTLEPGDLLVCEGGEVGRAAIWRGDLAECYYQKAIHRLRARTKQDEHRFVFYVLFAAAKMGVFVAHSNPNTIDHLTAEKLRHHRFAFPPIAEQHGVVGFLDRETAKLDALIAKVREGLERLKEYRTALISAAVTGKIDVREAV